MVPVQLSEAVVSLPSCPTIIKHNMDYCCDNMYQGTKFDGNGLLLSQKACMQSLVNLNSLTHIEICSKFEIKNSFSKTC